MFDGTRLVRLVSVEAWLFVCGNVDSVEEASVLSDGRGFSLRGVALARRAWGRVLYQTGVARARG